MTGSLMPDWHGLAGQDFSPSPAAAPRFQTSSPEESLAIQPSTTASQALALLKVPNRQQTAAAVQQDAQNGIIVRQDHTIQVS